MDKSQRKTRFSKKRIVFILVAIFFAFAFVLAWLWPDASTNYNDAREDAAKEGVKFIAQMSSGINYASHFGTIRLTAESVAETEAAKAVDSRCNTDFKSDAEPKATKYYTVVVGYRTLFGILIGTDPVRVCRYY